MLRLAIPSEGNLKDATLGFLKDCNLPVVRPSERRLTGGIATDNNIVVFFQRSEEVTSKVEEGSADLGVVGRERFYESRREGGEALEVLPDLGYGNCELALEVPDAWIDVTSTVDLVDLSLKWREEGREFRLATKYPRLVQQFFHRRGLNFFSLVEVAGALEGAPSMGYADIVAEIISTGTTLRENRLKTLADGTIFKAQACLIGNVELLRRHEDKLAVTKRVLELMEAHLRASRYYSITGNIRGNSPEAAVDRLMLHPELAGLQGPTISRVYDKEGEGGWFAVTVVVARDQLLAAVEHLRSLGGQGITVTPAQYLFEGECLAYRTLLERLGLA